MTTIQEHWNQRASLGEKAGTQDLILKRLEQRAILAEIRAYFSGFYDDSRILEIGCGLGETASLVAAARQGLNVLAIDNAPKMIEQARARDHSPRVVFSVRDVTDLPRGPFDIIYSQRCLINLPTWEEQFAALEAIAVRLMPSGRFLMCEHSQDGLDHINDVRTSWNRPAIQRPWHNRYFQDSELAAFTSLELLRCVPFSATYYFLSRVLNDKLAEAEGKEPPYDAHINTFAGRLPADCVDPRFAQGRLWVWEKPLKVGA